MMATLLRVLAYLPLWLLHFLGAAAGWATYLGSRRYAARMRENLTASGVCAPGRCGGLLRRVVAEAGKSVLELPAIWLRPERQALQLLKQCHGWEHVEAALARGKGLIFLTPHMGCFEITSLYYAARHPITVLYRPPRLHWLQPLMEAGRKRGQVTLAPTDVGGVRALFRALRRGEAIGILPDQVPGQGEGVWVDFLGRPAYTMTLAPRLARSTGAAIVFAYAERLPHGAGYELWLEALSEDLPEDPAAAAEVINRAVEGLIRKKPEQYLWSYNRYKVPKGAMSNE
ncbi:lysophospholipid acyltransferase family protein [Sulfuricella sp.]|uniref:lysophospholipid acyltransferase family protein n=1 Tax=Sulfuricella sp. TaxID=2099377 RepID=UPI002C2B3409|nr:lysophospholipid acyltransferase family protein [Sulfuricella sp.]HUX64952.1 lysophospholipid acyltransferase family protein [Sulfuricella sp.]